MTGYSSSRSSDSGAVDAVLVRVGGARVEARVVHAAVGKDPVDGVSGEARRVPGRCGKLTFTIASSENIYK